jgi:hypothetical protein
VASTLRLPATPPPDIVNSYGTSNSGTLAALNASALAHPILHHRKYSASIRSALAAEQDLLSESHHNQATWVQARSADGKLAIPQIKLQLRVMFSWGKPPSSA